MEKHYVTIGAILLVLCLSANTTFADFPRVCRTVSQDGFLPLIFAMRGRRLVYTQDIIVPTVLAGSLLIFFNGPGRDAEHGTAIHVIPLPTQVESWQSELIGSWDLPIDSGTFPKDDRLKFANALKKSGNPFTVPATKLRISGQKGFLRIIHAV